MSKSISAVANAIFESQPGVRDFYSGLMLWFISARDSTLDLAEVKLLNENSYEWLRVLKYNYGIYNIFNI